MDAPSDLAALPKAELHVHLEGTVRPATLKEFSTRAGISVPKAFTDLNSFVDSYVLAWQTMSSPGDYARLVREYCEDRNVHGGCCALATQSACGPRTRRHSGVV